MGHVIAAQAEPVALEEPVTVVDIHALHEDAQRFVVGALLSQIFEEKQGQGREPLRFVVLDELNKYAPKEGTSPIKEILIDIASRGRSLGVLLIGAQQSASEVEPAIIRNAALKVVGRLDAGEAGEYRFLSSELRERASRFLPGTMVLDQPLIPAPIPVRFPFPAFATNVSEGRSGTEEERAAASAEAFARLR
jgi:DNA helicase HerA-like ATPase